MRTLFLSLSLVLLAGCGINITINETPDSPTPPAATDDATQVEELTTDGVATETNVDPLLVEAMTDGILDEYRAEAIYRSVMEDFGEIRPFVMIARSEVQHQAMLAELFRARGLPVPDNTWANSPELPHFESVEAACAAGVTAEIDNAAIYTDWLAKLPNVDDDVRWTFEMLSSASSDNHLAAFENCGAGGSMGGGMGRGMNR